ncbi:hypothetical protein PCASD_22681 [Puccinia coronata f. sp. avenae]|uniref:Uncharacterized protein n=1 Tax=Puccinia coronata f. sp. avenae TaxID=200324 RepID=A0A2N5TJU9_9BASI|nr:hypothetical protein PCASD_22681 [Puccinia coronata f. sp. avenae]
MDSKVFPPPATEREKAKWKSNSENDYLDVDYLDDDGEAMCSPSSVSSGDSDNPAFPYGDGPGHRDASAATLKIMWRSMQRCGVVSFRPDFSRAASILTTPSYGTLRIAYSSICRAYFSNLPFSHREAGYSSQHHDEYLTRKRRQMRTVRLRDSRIKFATSQAMFIPLIPVITDCTSNAETEAGDDDDDNDADDQTNKRVIVSSLPWRHPRIGRAFQLIDRLIELQRESGCNDYGRAPGPRLRPRDPKISNWPCPQGHSSKVYCKKWLKIRKLPEVNKINIQPGLSYKNIIKELERMV